jgi:hypothetical protein
MHKRRRVEAADFAEIFLGVAAVIGDRGVDPLVTRCRQERHKRSEAIAKDGNFPDALRKPGDSINRVLDVPDAGVPVILLIKPVLPVGVGGYVEVDLRLLTPEQVGGGREEPLGRQFIACRPDVGVNPKQFLKNDHGGCWQLGRPRDVGPEFSVRFDVDLILNAGRERKAATAQSDDAVRFDDPEPDRSAKMAFLRTNDDHHSPVFVDDTVETLSHVAYNHRDIVSAMRA